MKALLGYNHPTYLRRMARELSNRSAGFYWRQERWNRACFTQGVLRISRTMAWDADGEVSVEQAHTFVTLEGVAFDDGNGSEIYASRKAVS